jgi:hypothetical protein
VASLDMTLSQKTKPNQTNTHTHYIYDIYLYYQVHLIHINMNIFTYFIHCGQVLVTHTYNPSCSGGRDQEDQVSKPAPAISLKDPFSKKTHQEKGLMEWLKV